MRIEQGPEDPDRSSSKQFFEINKPEFSHQEGPMQPTHIQKKEHGIQLPHRDKKRLQENEVDRKNKQAYQNLTTAMASRITNVHEKWKKQHGYENLSWDEIFDKPELRNNPDLVPGNLEFEPQWHRGSVLNGQEVKVDFIKTPGNFDPTMWGKAATEKVSNEPLEEQYASDLKSLSFSTRKEKKVDNWYVHFTPNRPPMVVNWADAEYVRRSYDDPKAIKLIKEAFGEDAVPHLSESEMKTLTLAILNTPAKIAE